MRTLEKDILLICKNWYNEEKYNSTLEALNGYYHKEYGCEKIIMDKEFAIELFLKPTFVKYGNIEYIFEKTWDENTCSNYDNSFVSIFYDRLTCGICKAVVKDKIDLSDYQGMFDKAKECNYEDKTIGII